MAVYPRILFRSTAMSEYLIILAGSLLFPLIYSFERQIAFYRKWPSLFPAILIVAVFFIGWDMVFTAKGIWWFNPANVGNLKIGNLPVEECLFFIVIPYVSVFTYEVLKLLPWLDLRGAITRWVSLVLFVVFSIVTIVFIDRAYTVYAFGLSALLLFLFNFVLKFRQLGRFLITYLIILVPFTLVNGLLTGTFMKQATVLYNDNENLGIRFLTIPLEDIFYGFSMLLMTVYLYELFSRRQKPVVKQ
jgi:lycopene cyclase domain-containing protein